MSPSVGSASGEAARQAREHLYGLIRAELAQGTPVATLVTATGLSRERIYQIRDGRR